MKKWIIRIFIAFVILIVVVVLGIAFFLDGAIKKGIEIVGPKMTKVDVKVRSVSVSIFSGSGKVQGLVVGNPPGFDAPSSINVGSASLGLVTSSVLSDKVIVRTIDVQQPEITFETGLHGNNLIKIKSNLTEGGGGEQAPAKSQPTSQAEAARGQKKLEVDDFVIKGAKLTVSVTGVGSLSETMPDIHLQDLGKGPDGITASELTKEVLDKLLSVAIQEGEKLAGDIAKGAVKLPGSLGNSTTNISNTAKGVLDLFKKK
jgi:hypothetical protein